MCVCKGERARAGVRACERKSKHARKRKSERERERERESCVVLCVRPPPNNPPSFPLLSLYV